MVNRRLGIHFAPGALKLVEVEEQAKKLKLVNYSIDFLPPGNEPAARVKALVESLKKNKIHTKEANIVIQGSDIVYKLVELPDMSEKEITSALKYKIKNTLPLSFNEVVIDHYRLEKGRPEGKNSYFVAAVPKENILSFVGSVKASGLILKDIIVPSVAFKNALGEVGPEPTALIYLGKYSSVIVLIEGGQVVFAREAKIGGEDITNAMVGQVQTEQGRLEIDYKRAEEIKSQYGIPINHEQYSAEVGLPAAEVMAMMRPALEKLSAEILGTFEYYRGEIGEEIEFKKVYFSGGVSKTKNILTYFKEQLGLEVAALSPKIEATSQDFADKAPFLSLALGAVFFGKDHLSLMPKEDQLFNLPNLLPANFLPLAVRTIKQSIKLFFVGGIIVLALAIVYSWFYMQRSELGKQQQVLQKEYKSRMTEIGQRDELQKIINLIKYGQRDRFTLVINELDKVTPEEVYFSKLNYKNDSNELIIKGIVLKKYGKTSMANFMKDLSLNKLFSAITLVFMQESDAYTLPTYDFELKCQLAGGGKK
ncbi:hypothetical protein A3H38_03325 [candidate division WOR-1 bacterium RIFCSPLOWO2_02_FULL_46_20]|uniref:SHS2 domain-containing protein n=2 Tax=Saganbacteria TaxID=1703751 RepID=A0A1F4RGC5_UNCSA|nr:MAG: hypothetical protein A3H38_03325 [candidate division WOR-1 bacterium RIFCSPLOWO2_02_FULL_46_20]OGC10000.1 MAG: hypothetical protein A3F86_03725 [candidate division WOR-1 bacterium RIFCSPLOWO2_12_FULL_45_9]